MLPVGPQRGMRHPSVHVVHARRLGHVDGVVFIGVAVSPAVQNDQCGFHAANVGDDSTPLRPNRTHRKAAFGLLFHFKLGPMRPHGFATRYKPNPVPSPSSVSRENGFKAAPGLQGRCPPSSTTSTEAKYPSHCHATCTWPVECFKHSQSNWPQPTPTVLGPLPPDGLPRGLWARQPSLGVGPESVHHGTHGLVPRKRGSLHF